MQVAALALLVSTIFIVSSAKKHRLRSNDDAPVRVEDKVSTSVRRDFISSCCGHYSCPNINTSSAFAAKGKNFKPRREKRRRQRVIVVVVRGSKIGDDQYQDSFQDTQEDTRYLPVLYSDGDDDDEPYKSDAGTGSSHSYCPRYTCQPNKNHDWHHTAGNNDLATTDGTFKEFRGRTYFFSKIKRTWRDGAADCCKRNMRLATITRKKEKQIEPFWVAGSDRGGEGDFKWCYPDRLDDFEDPPFISWKADEPNNFRDQENCIELVTKHESLMLNDNYCNRNRSYICESELSKPKAVVVKKEVPKCPKFSCDNANNYIPTANLGYMEKMASKTYFFGYESNSWSNAARVCCEQGMRLATIETPEEASSLSQHFKSKFHGSITWWVAASDNAVEGEYNWCLQDKTVEFQKGQLIPWGEDEPSDRRHKENCLALEGRGPKLFMNDVECSKKQRYICEAPLEYETGRVYEEQRSSYATMRDDKCSSMICLQEKHLERKEIENYDDNFLGKGRAVEIRGSLFVVSASKATKESAVEYCCRRGMRLLTLANSKKIKAVKELAEKLMRDGRSWWLGASDKAKEADFRWCFPDVAATFNFSFPFAQGEPNNGKGMEENCLQLRNDDGKLFLRDEDCYHGQAGFVCEESPASTKAKKSNPCKSLPCPKENKQFIQESSNADTLLESNATRLVTSPSGNQYFLACENIYIVINKPMSWSNSFTECCRYGYESLRFDSVEDLLCFKKSFNELFTNQTYSVDQLWTSSGVAKADDPFFWCTGSEEVDQTMWAEAQPDKSNTCVSVDTKADGKTSLRTTNCETQLLVACQP